MEQFIEKVKKYPCLWDVGDAHYRDYREKDGLWNKVAKECGIKTGKEAKLQWKRLRDSHREALRRRKSSTGLAQCPWKYEKIMEFIIPNNNTSGNDKYTNVEYLEWLDGNEGAEDAVPEEAAEEETPAKRVKEEHDHLEREWKEQKGKLRDPLTNLFISLCEKTRVLPRRLQLRVQREVFDSVARAEEEALGFDVQLNYAAPHFNLFTTSSPTNSEYKRNIKGSPK